MIAFKVFGWPVYRYGIMYLIGFLVGYRFLWYVTRKQYVTKVSPTLQTILDGNVDLLLTYIIIGGILGGRLGEVLIYEPGYYFANPDQILATWNGGMSFIGGIIGALIAVGLFLWLHRPKTKDQKLQTKSFLALTDMMAAIAPFGIMLGRIGNWLNRELYGPLVYNADMISSRVISWLWERSGDGVLLIKGSLYTALEKLSLVYDYGTMQMYAGEMRLNTNFLASFGEGLLILIMLQILFWTRRKYGKMRAWILSGLFLILYSLIRFVLEYVRIDSLDDYIAGLTSTQWLSIVMVVIGAMLIWWPRKK